MSAASAASHRKPPLRSPSSKDLGQPVLRPRLTSSASERKTVPDESSQAPGGPDHHGGQEPAGAGDAWTVKEAKARFSEVFDRALDRPQRISRRGKQAVVMMSAAEYERLR